MYDKSGNNGLNLAVLHLSDYMLSTPDYFKNLGWGESALASASLLRRDERRLTIPFPLDRQATRTYP